MQKKPSQDLQLTQTSSKEDKAEFARRCFLLSELLQLDISEEAKDNALASMWRQSEAVIGIQ